MPHLTQQHKSITTLQGLLLAIHPALLSTSGCILVEGASCVFSFSASEQYALKIFLADTCFV